MRCVCCGQGMKTSGEVCVVVRVWRLQVRYVCCGQGVKTSGEGCVCCGQGMKTSGEVCVLWSGCEDFR